MTNAQTGTLVLQDGAGDYFLVPQETLEQGRVPGEHKAEVERLVAEAAQGGADGEDVQGYFSLGILFGYGVIRMAMDIKNKVDENSSPSVWGVVRAAASPPQ